MGWLSPELAGIVNERHGVVTDRQLLADGLAPSLVRRLHDRGLLRTLAPGVHLAATHRPTLEARCLAAQLVLGGVISGLSAGRLRGFAHLFPSRIVTLRCERPPSRSIRGVEIVLGPVRTDDVDVRPDGLRVAAAPLAWFDLAPHLSDERFEALTADLLLAENDDRVALSELFGVVARHDRRGRPGLDRAHRVLSRRPDWQRPPAEELERRLQRALRRRGLRPLRRGTALELPDGSLLHPAVAIPELRWAVELDHTDFHGGRYSERRSRRRARLVADLGWTVIVTPAATARDDVGRLADELVAGLPARAA